MKKESRNPIKDHGQEILLVHIHSMGKINLFYTTSPIYGDSNSPMKMRGTITYPQETNNSHLPPLANGQ